jgi:hypothetical protein
MPSARTWLWNDHGEFIRAKLNPLGFNRSQA